MAIPTKLTPRTITKLAAERKEVMAQIDELTKRKAEIDERLLQADTAQTYRGNGIELSFTAVHTLDAALITKKYPATKFPDFYKLTLDTPAFKKNFSANDLAKLQKVSHRISVKIAED
jgi:hypothetical protein